MMFKLSPPLSPSPPGAHQTVDPAAEERVQTDGHPGGGGGTHSAAGEAQGQDPAEQTGAQQHCRSRQLHYIVHGGNIVHTDICSI